jgi:hypothetical protein
MVRFWNCKNDLGARLPKSYLFGRLRKLFIIPIKINFDETQEMQIIAKYIHYMMINLHMHKRRYPSRKK